MFKVLVVSIITIVFSGCVGTESPVGKGVVYKPHHTTMKPVQK